MYTPTNSMLQCHTAFSICYKILTATQVMKKTFESIIKQKHVSKIQLENGTICSLIGEQISSNSVCVCVCSSGLFPFHLPARFCWGGVGRFQEQIKQNCSGSERRKQRKNLGWERKKGEETCLCCHQNHGSVIYERVSKSVCWCLSVSHFGYDVIISKTFQQLFLFSSLYRHSFFVFRQS